MFQVLILTVILSQSRPNQSNQDQARLQGFQQQGQLTSDAAITRDPNNFVGGNSDNFLDGNQNQNPNQNPNQNLGRANSNIQGRSQNQNRNRNNTNRNTSGMIRSHISFNYQDLQSPVSYINPKIPKTIRRIPGLENSSITVEMFGKTATITGIVSNQKEKELIARLILLEPGISRIINELVVE